MSSPENNLRDLRVRSLVLAHLNAQGRVDRSTFTTAPDLQATDDAAGEGTINPGALRMDTVLGRLFVADANGVLRKVPQQGAAQTDLILDAATELTISSGAITVIQAAHTVDTESDAASDNLDTISGTTAEEIVVLRPASAARTVVLRDASVGSGNIRTPGQRSISLAEATDYAVLYSDGTNVTVIAYRTQALSGGGLGVALASTASGDGAALVGVEDGDSYFTGTDVEAVLAELGATRLRSAQVTIAAGSVATLNATPVQLVAAPGAGFCIEVESIHWFLDFASSAYDAAASGDTLVARYTDGSGAIVVDAVAGDAIGAASADYHVVVQPVAEVIPVENAALVAHITTGEWGTGDSPLKADVLYRIRPFTF